ncbi:RNA 2',3'-cyclic phosphodiesterase [Neptunicella sp.]|uniref:RNA 2',3'-cyclic phosphodiesterase n=1 Tax=Neptunicella sp. TaxID=2125986 RepID=UPI003F68F099
MRCFLGLEPDSQTKLAIEDWRERNFASLQGPVPMTNFHLTLLFLGQLEQHQINQLYQNIQQLQDLPGFTVTLNQIGYWPKPKALWLGAEQTPAQLDLLVDTLTRIVHQCHIDLQKRPYIPHLTLFRKCSQNPPAALIEPAFTCHFDQFHLFESVSSRHGVSYQRRASWSLD